MNNENAKVPKVLRIKSLELMVKLDEINDRIPYGTSYVIENKEVECLRTEINDVIIEFTKDYKSIDNILSIKKLYEYLTIEKVEIIDIDNNGKYQLFILLNELIDKIPEGISALFMRDRVSCLKNTILIIKEGHMNYPHDTYWKLCIREIYKIMEYNGHSQFNGKY